MNKESFILYNSFYEPIKTLKDEQLGKLLRAIFEYTINGKITNDNDILIAFMFIKNQLDIDNEKWQSEKKKRSEAGKKGMASRWNNEGNITKDNNAINSYNKDSSDINSITKITDNDNENDSDNENVNDNINNIITPSKKETKNTYGEYKRVKLTDKEYQKLCEDYGKEKLDGQIKLLDEYVESNNNKNKYTNFNLVVRKSFRENWFKKDNKNTGVNYESV